MKIGVYCAYWEHEWGGDYIRYIKKAAALGFDVLEISCVSLPESDDALRNLRDCAREYGIMLSSGYGPARDQDLSSEDAAVVENGKKYMTEVLRKLEILGIGVVGGGLYSYWPVEYSQPFDKARRWDNAVKNIRYMANIAESCGVTLCMETLNRFEGFLINTAKECREFVEQVGHDAVRVMLDTFHMNIEEDSFGQAIATAGDLLGHFHIGEANRRVPGKGRLPWKEIGLALNGIGYQGICVMEPFVMTGGGIGSDIKVWHELEADTTEQKLDADSKKSLAFTRFMFEKEESV